MQSFCLVDPRVSGDPGLVVIFYFSGRGVWGTFCNIRFHFDTNKTGIKAKIRLMWSISRSYLCQNGPKNSGKKYYVAYKVSRASCPEKNKKLWSVQGTICGVLHFYVKNHQNGSFNEAVNNIPGMSFICYLFLSIERCWKRCHEKWSIVKFKETTTPT